MKFFTSLSPRDLKSSYKLFALFDWLPLKFHYYQPILKLNMLPNDYNQVESQIVGVDFHTSEQLSLLNRFDYNNELELIPKHETCKSRPYYSNSYFGSGDAEILYNMIRHYKPKKFIEIGAGHSTKFAQLAIEKNQIETCKNVEHICIEPHGNSWLEEIGIRVIRKKVEEVPLSFFSELSRNDILFIDSSHIIRTSGDVVYEYLHVIPSLSSGVIVHCHDIFTPRDYPVDWIDGFKYFWNEQYLLQALLSFSSRYRVILSLNYLAHHYKTALGNCCPDFKREEKSEPSSFWFQII